MECTICNHTWVAVYPHPLEDEGLECPNCGYINALPDEEGYYVLFMGDINNPLGGAYDMHGVFDSIEEAKQSANELLISHFGGKTYEETFAHVYDTANANIIELW